VILFCIVVALLIPGTLQFGGLSLFDILIYSTIAIFLFKRLSSEKNINKINKNFEAPLYLFLIAVIVSYGFNANSFNAQNDFVESIGLSSKLLFSRLSIYGLATIVMIIGLYHLILDYASSEVAIKSTLKIIIYTGALNALITIIAWYLETGGVFGRYNFLPPLEQSQGIHVSYMVVVFLISFGIREAGVFNSKFEQFVIFITMILTIFSTLTVMTRGGWIVFILTFIVYITLSRRGSFGIVKRQSILPQIALIFFGIIFVYYNSEGVLIESFLELFGDSFQDNSYSSTFMRLVMIENAISIFLNNIFLGIGYGHYPAYSSVPVIVSGQEIYVSSPHNGIITVLAEGGILGLSIYLWFCLSVMKELYKSYKYASNKLFAVISTAAFSLMLVEFFLQFTGNSRILPIPTERVAVQSSFIFWVICFLAISSKRNFNLSKYDRVK
jgi:O-antigen ligase